MNQPEESDGSKCFSCPGCGIRIGDCCGKGQVMASWRIQYKASLSAASFIWSKASLKACASAIGMGRENPFHEAGLKYMFLHTGAVKFSMVPQIRPKIYQVWMVYNFVVHNFVDYHRGAKIT